MPIVYSIAYVCDTCGARLTGESVEAMYSGDDGPVAVTPKGWGEKIRLGSLSLMCPACLAKWRAANAPDKFDGE